MAKPAVTGIMAPNPPHNPSPLPILENVVHLRRLPASEIWVARSSKRRPRPFFSVLGPSGLTELSTHFRQQRILYGFRQIRGFNLGRIDLPAGGPGHPDRNLMTPSMQGHGDFGFQRIAGIHDQIALR